MTEFLIKYHEWLEIFHIISVISWMAGMLYLPRLFVYHAGVKKKSPESEMLKKMEKRLIRIIINPAMIATFIFGGLLAYAGGHYTEGWFHAKFTLALIMAGVHGMFSRWRKAFEKDKNKKSEKFFRIANEVPTALMIAIVIIVILKPF